MDQVTISNGVLQRFEPLSMFGVERLVDLSTRISLQSVPAGESIFSPDNKNQDAIFLLTGVVTVTTANGDTENIGADSDKARFSLANPRYVSATALSDASVMKMEQNTLDLMVTWDQLATAESQRARLNDEIATAKFLNKYNKSFTHIPIPNILELFKLVEPIKVPQGQVLINQGDEGDYFYMIDTGKALVQVEKIDEDGAEAIELFELEEGTSFGEDALLTNNKRNATVSMMTDGTLLRLSKENFLALLNEPEIDWLSPKEAQIAVKGGARWLDVRHETEFEQARLSKAINIPLHEINNRKEELDPAAHYICYCDTGRRSSAAAYLLKDTNIHVSVLRDGILGLSRKPPH